MKFLNIFIVSILAASMAQGFGNEVDQFYSGVYKIKDPSCLNGPDDLGGKKDVSLYFLTTSQKVLLDHEYVVANFDAKKHALTGGRAGFEYCVSQGSEKDCYSLEFQRKENTIIYKGPMTIGAGCVLKMSPDQSFQSHIAASRFGKDSNYMKYLSEKSKSKFLTAEGHAKYTEMIRKFEQIEADNERAEAIAKEKAAADAAAKKSKDSAAKSKVEAKSSVPKAN